MADKENKKVEEQELEEVNGGVSQEVMQRIQGILSKIRQGTPLTPDEQSFYDSLPAEVHIVS
ncbi:conjugal transfer protein TraH, partial [Ruminococcaceae bacterium OttesenSCG-928-I18]|nr:conjugal transfer protein TraH [Ruminococcaceae bacterium OttesenSCG-928-I18]